MWWFIPGPPSGFRRLDSSCSTLFRYITVCIHFAIYILTIGLEVKQLSLGSDTKFFNHRADANGSLEEGRPSSRNSSRGPQRRCRDNFPLESASDPNVNMLRMGFRWNISMTWSSSYVRKFLIHLDWRQLQVRQDYTLKMSFGQCCLEVTGRKSTIVKRWALSLSLYL